jgi:hypothetical protein
VLLEKNAAGIPQYLLEMKNEEKRKKETAYVELGYCSGYELFVYPFYGRITMLSLLLLLLTATIGKRIVRGSTP